MEEITRQQIIEFSRNKHPEEIVNIIDGGT